MDAELIDLRSLKPIDYETIFTSLEKTKHLLVIDPDFPICSLASEIVATAAEKGFSSLKRLSYPDAFCPTSFSLAKEYYPLPADIALAALTLLDKPLALHSSLPALLEKKMGERCDTPDPTFTGPF